MSVLFELNPRNAITIGLLVILALIPLYAALTGNTFVMTLFTRVIIMAIAAVDTAAEAARRARVGPPRASTSVTPSAFIYFRQSFGPRTLEQPAWT